MKTKIIIGGIPISEDFRVMPGAGIAKNLVDVKRLCENEDIQILLFGSITLLSRTGNPGNIFFVDPFGNYTVNSVGMTNSGLGGYQHTLKEIVNYVHSKGKKIVVSIASVDHVKDYIPLLALVAQSGADGCELNYGCPNVLDGGKQHAIASFNPPVMQTSLSLMKEKFGMFMIPIWVKLSLLVIVPNALRIVNHGDTTIDVKLDVELMNKVSKVINDFDFIKAVVCTNTLGSIRVQDEGGKPVLGPNPDNPNLSGGLAGLIIHKYSVEQARLMRHLLNKEIDIIGAGGVINGQTTDDFMKVGTVGVQVVSTYWVKNNPVIFSEIGADYYENYTK
jgi:dihydroorotate dehydrogenase (fumarate)